MWFLQHTVENKRTTKKGHKLLQITANGTITNIINTFVGVF